MVIAIADYVDTDVDPKASTHSVLVPGHEAGDRLLMIGAMDNNGDVSSVADLGGASWAEIADISWIPALTAQYVDAIADSDIGELPSGLVNIQTYQSTSWVVGVETSTDSPTVEFEDTINNTEALTHAVTVPDHGSGDLLLLLCASDDGSVPTTIAAINGVAWNKLDDYQGSHISGAAYYAVATSDQATNTTVDVTLATSEHFGARIYRVTDHVGVPEISARSSEHDGFNSLKGSWGTNDAVWFYLYGQHSGYNNLSLPIGYTATQYNNSNGDFNQIIFSVGHRIGAAATLLPEFVDVTLAASETGAWRVFRVTGHDATQAPEVTTWSANSDIVAFNPLTPSWGEAENAWFYAMMIVSSYDISAYPSGYTHQANNFSRESLFTGYKIATGTTEDPDDINNAYNRYASSMVLAIKPGAGGGGGEVGSSQAAVMLVA